MNSMSAILIGYEDDFAVQQDDEVKVPAPDDREERAIRREMTKASRTSSTPRGVKTRAQSMMDGEDGPPPPKARRLVLEPIAVTIENSEAGTSMTRPNFEQQAEVEEIFRPGDSGYSGRVSAHSRLAPRQTEASTTLVVEEEEEASYGEEEREEGEGDE